MKGVVTIYFYLYVAQNGKNNSPDCSGNLFELPGKAIQKDCSGKREYGLPKKPKRFAPKNNWHPF